LVHSYSYFLTVSVLVLFGFQWQAGSPIRGVGQLKAS